MIRKFTHRNQPSAKTILIFFVDGNSGGSRLAEEIFSAVMQERILNHCGHRRKHSAFEEKSFNHQGHQGHQE
jgi:hypothetical protein